MQPVFRIQCKDPENDHVLASAVYTVRVLQQHKDTIRICIRLLLQNPEELPACSDVSLCGLNITYTPFVLRVKSDPPLLNPSNKAA